MDISSFGKFATQFGLIKSPCSAVAKSFQTWQNEILSPYGLSLRLEPREGALASVLDSLYPLTAPVVTKYLFWPLSAGWTLYFDNGIGGTDPTSPFILSGRLHTEAMRVSMANQEVNPETGKVSQYGGTILEIHADGAELRHVFAMNDGGRWQFGQSGEPFKFEDAEAYKARTIRERFTPAMLLSYLREFGVILTTEGARLEETGEGILLTKQGNLPMLVKERRSD